MTNSARNWIGFGIILAVTIAAALVLGSQAQKSMYSPAPSSFNAAPRGIKALFVTLEKLNWPINRWQRKWTRLSSNGILLYTAANQFDFSAARRPIPPSTEEATALAHWVARGNTLIYFDNEFSPPTHELLWKRFGIGFREKPRETAARKIGEGLWQAESRQSNTVRVVVPTAITRDVRALVLESKTGVQPDQGAIVPLVDDGQGGLHVFRVDHGAGRAYFISTPSLIDNDFIARADNFQLLLNLLKIELEAPSRRSRAAAGMPLSIMFDEYHHGYSMEYAMRDFLALPMVRFTAIQIALILAVVIFSQSRRFGHPIPLVRETRRSVMEYTHSLGNLYKRAETQLEALDFLYHGLRRELINRHSLRSDATIEEISLRFGTDTGLRRQWENLARLCEQTLQLRSLTRARFTEIAREIQLFRRQQR